MALVLSFRQGNDFYIGAKRYVVSEVVEFWFFRIRSEDGEVYDVSDKEWTKLGECIWVQAGLQNKIDSEGLVRLCVDAPIDIIVNRGDVHRSLKGDKNGVV